MNVALLLESDGPGGAEQMLIDLATELRDRGHGVVPVGPREGVGWMGARLREQGFRPDSFHLSSTFDPACATRLRRLFLDRKVDVVHAHEFSMAVYGSLAARLAGLPRVITMHGSRYYAAHPRRRWAMRWATRGAAAVVGVSRATAADLEATLGLSAAKVIHNGRRMPDGRGEGVRAEFGLEPADRLVLSVGNLYPVKGHDVLIRAAGGIEDAVALEDGNGHGNRTALARGETGGKLHVAVIGEGGERERLARTAAELGIASRVHLPGYRSDVADLLAAADVFALPSLSEGLPLALLEAMLAGKPIVATRVGGVPEVIQDGSTGLLVEAGSEVAFRRALGRVLEDEALGARLGAAAKAEAERSFTPSAMAEAYEEVYRSATEGRRALAGSRSGPARTRHERFDTEVQGG